MILEGTDRTVHFIYHTAGIERARRKGMLRPDAFLRIAPSPGPTVGPVLQDLGNVDRFVTRSTCRMRCTG